MYVQVSCGTPSRSTIARSQTKMEDELTKLKTMLRSLVVSSPTPMNSQGLMRDYWQMVGKPVPFVKYGYRDFATFIRERLTDTFLLGGPSYNPILTPIIPESLKHIDKFISKQKISPLVKCKGKRSSVLENKISPTTRAITKVNQDNNQSQSVCNNVTPVSLNMRTIVKTQNDKNNIERPKDTSSNNTKMGGGKHRINLLSIIESSTLSNSQNKLNEGPASCDEDSSVNSDSGRMTSSSASSLGRHKQAVAIDKLKIELADLISDYPEGIWTVDLLRLYRKKFDHELKFERLGYLSIKGLVRELEGSVFHVQRPDPKGDWRLYDYQKPEPPPPLRRPRHLRHSFDYLSKDNEIGPDDALPGIDIDPSMFPSDCMQFLECIETLKIDSIEPGAQLELMVGEVYSPSHFWIQLLGENYNIAMEETMDQMNKYYKGEGHKRFLPFGAVRVGHYCTSIYERDWHRSVIVQVLDSEQVKVRHIDYGTVEKVHTSGLKPLLRVWGHLKAQAIRARLAGVRPAGGACHWSHAASAQFLELVRDRKFVGEVVAVDHQEGILELYLVDTSTEEDVCINEELVRAGHADCRKDSSLHILEPYLLPTYIALEDGETPNYAEIYKYLQSGINLEFIEEYRKHVLVNNLTSLFPVDYILQRKIYHDVDSITKSSTPESEENMDYPNTSCSSTKIETHESSLKSISNDNTPLRFDIHNSPFQLSLKDTVFENQTRLNQSLDAMYETSENGMSDHWDRPSNKSYDLRKTKTVGQLTKPQNSTPNLRKDFQNGVQSEMSVNYPKPKTNNSSIISHPFEPHINTIGPPVFYQYPNTFNNNYPVNQPCFPPPMGMPMPIGPFYNQLPYMNCPPRRPPQELYPPPFPQHPFPPPFPHPFPPGPPIASQLQQLPCYGNNPYAARRIEDVLRHSPPPPYTKQVSQSLHKNQPLQSLNSISTNNLNNITNQSGICPSTQASVSSTGTSAPVESILSVNAAPFEPKTKGTISLSLLDCEVFKKLAQLDMNMANKHIADKINQALDTFANTNSHKNEQLDHSSPCLASRDALNTSTIETQTELSEEELEKQIDGGSTKTNLEESSRNINKCVSMQDLKSETTSKGNSEVQTYSFDDLFSMQNEVPCITPSYVMLGAPPGFISDPGQPK